MAEVSFNADKIIYHLPIIYSDKVETILQETLTEAKGESDKMTVQLTLEQVMEIRESFLERIKNLYKFHYTYWSAASEFSIKCNIVSK